MFLFIFFIILYFLHLPFIPSVREDGAPQYRCFPFFKQCMLNLSYYLVFIDVHTTEKNYVSQVLRFGFTFLLDLNIVLMEAFLLKCCNSVCFKSCFTYDRSPGCLSTEGLLITLEGNRHLALMKGILHPSKLVP